MSKEERRPKISVVMAVLNGQEYLAEAIESVLGQSFSDFEFFIVNDGSIDGTEEIIKKYLEGDNRIRYLKNEINFGQSRSWNRAIEVACGEFIVRMDADDICIPNRFEKQYQYMILHPNIGVLGSRYYIFSTNKEEKSRSGQFFDIKDGRPPVHHPTCCIRRKLFESFGYYNSHYDNAEDTELWYRMYAAGVKFANLGDYLLMYRVHGGNVSIKKIRQQVYLQLKVNLLGVFKYRIHFSMKGYIRVLELFFYFIYLSLGLDKIYRRGK